MTYIFTCLRCGAKIEQESRSVPECATQICVLAGTNRMIRDYRTESVNVDRSSLR